MGVVRSVLAAVLAFAACAAFSARAEDWPSRPIIIVTGFPTGAGTDIYARLLSEPLGKALGVNVVVEARTGAGGNVGSEYVARARPDGYTLLLGTAGTHAINVTLYQKLPFDVEKDFQPITLLGDVPNVLIVNNDVPAKTVREFIALAKANPGKLNYSSAGNGTSLHLAGERFKALAKVDIVHVPFRGTPPAMTALLANEVQAMFQQTIPVMELIKAGSVRALGVTTEQRVEALPDIPTISEAGLPGYESSTWYGLFAPAGTPRPIVDRLNREVVRIVRTPEFAVRLKSLGITPRTSTPEEFAQVIRDDIARWRGIVIESGAKLD